ncbi:chaplin family protein [Streptomyces sp. NPDC059743]|uniref:chaplin family protein n=1 Tax=Streptomyces sp. NPDC059743 TaxID=3346928 RepID=UPI003648A7B1
MRDLISKGLLAAAAASSVLSLGGGYAIAVESDGVAAGSPGVLSGNSVQAPIEVPVNVCGNTVDVVGVGNPAFGNGCVNTSGRPGHSAAHERSSSHQEHRAPARHDDRAPSVPEGPDHAPVAPPEDAPAHAPQRHETHPHQQAHPHKESTGAKATAIAKGSPGVGSGNIAQAPIDIPLNVCGNSVDLVGVLNPAFGNRCANGSPVALPDVHEEPQFPETPGAPEVPGTPETPGTPGGDEPGNEPGDGTDRTPPVPGTPPGDKAIPDTVTPATHSRPDSPAPVAELASTGSDAGLLGMAALSAGLMLGGGILYRRSTARARR